MIDTLDIIRASIGDTVRCSVYIGRIQLRDELKAFLIWLAEELERKMPLVLPMRPKIRRGSLAGSRSREGSNADAAGDAVGRHALTPFKRPRIVNGVSLNIDSHDDRHVLDLEFIDGFHAQVFKGNDPGRLDRF